ncbi:hypothetical protein GPALN_011910 [Globodera pallida]|nr:hypothetical protein GPALN_011910 [Globodera pallida]
MLCLPIFGLGQINVLGPMFALWHSFLLSSNWVEPHEEQFNGRWRDESALKGIVKVEHEPHYGAVKVEGADKIKHEFEWWDEESGTFKEQLDNRVKEEDQDGQAPNTSDHKKIVEPHEKQFDGRWQDESALKENVKVEHELHYGAVKVEGRVTARQQRACGDGASSGARRRAEEEV